MIPEFQRVKGVHPGAILKRVLSRQKLKAIELARAVDEHPQTINAITRERRGVNAKLSIKLGDYFSIDRDYFMLLQAAFEVRKSILTSNRNSLSKRIRKVLFWDVRFEDLDIYENKAFIIRRVFERGNDSELAELASIYGHQSIKQELETYKGGISPSFKERLEKYISTST